MELDELSQFNNAEIKQCLNLYDQLKNKNPDLAEKLKNSLINNASPDKNGNFSPTQLEAFKNIADSYKNNGQAYADNKDMDKALPQETAASEEFKNTCRNFWEKEAAANNMEYKENKDTPHFSAEVKTPNGKKVSFKASSGRNISLSCLDENGNPSVAPQANFNMVAKFIHNNPPAKLQFNPNRSDEYQARMLIACTQNGVEPIDYPDIEKLKNLEPETKKALAIAKIKLRKQELSHKEASDLNPAGHNTVQQNIAGKRGLNKENTVSRQHSEENAFTPQKGIANILRDRKQNLME